MIAKNVLFFIAMTTFAMAPNAQQRGFPLARAKKGGLPLLKRRQTGAWDTFAFKADAANAPRTPNVWLARRNIDAWLTPNLMGSCDVAIPMSTLETLKLPGQPQIVTLMLPRPPS